MSSPETETPSETSGNLAEKVEKIEDKIEKIFEMLKGGGSERGSETEPQGEEASVSATVKRELAKLHAEEERLRRESERDAKVDELSGKVAAIPERAPREYRKSTERMGWVTEADR